MHINIHTCTHCIHIWKCIYSQTYIHAHMEMHVHIHTCIHTVYVNAHTLHMHIVPERLRHMIPLHAHQCPGEACGAPTETRVSFGADSPAELSATGSCVTGAGRLSGQKHCRPCGPSSPRGFEANHRTILAACLEAPSRFQPRPDTLPASPQNWLSRSHLPIGHCPRHSSENTLLLAESSVAPTHLSGAPPHLLSGTVQLLYGGGEEKKEGEKPSPCSFLWAV